MRGNSTSKQVAQTATSLRVRLDVESKTYLAKAAQLRQMSVSDYVRTVTVPQAKREVQAAREQILTLTADEQLVFWTALCKPLRLTAAQKRLGKLMRGEK